MPRGKKSSSSEFMTSGVSISPAVPTAGGTVKIVYDGLLSKSGATHILAHVGFGSTWNNLQDIRMDRSTTGFEATIPVENSDTLNIAFKDCAENWDNNSGMNYTFDISQ